MPYDLSERGERTTAATAVVGFVCQTVRVDAVMVMKTCPFRLVHMPTISSARAEAPSSCPPLAREASILRSLTFSRPFTRPDFSAWPSGGGNVAPFVSEGEKISSAGVGTPSSEVSVEGGWSWCLDTEKMLGAP